jgi:hypothetical protein
MIETTLLRDGKFEIAVESILIGYRKAGVPEDITSDTFMTSIVIAGVLKSSAEAFVLNVLRTDKLPDSFECIGADTQKSDIKGKYGRFMIVLPDLAYASNNARDHVYELLAYIEYEHSGARNRFTLLTSSYMSAEHIKLALFGEWLNGMRDTIELKAGDGQARIEGNDAMLYLSDIKMPKPGEKFNVTGYAAQRAQVWFSRCLLALSPEVLYAIFLDVVSDTERPVQMWVEVAMAIFERKDLFGTTVTTEHHEELKEQSLRKFHHD